MPEQFDTPRPAPQHTNVPSSSGETCDLLTSTIREYLERGGVPHGLSEITTRLCREAQARGLSADETLAEIRSTLATVFAACPLTTSDRAALVALAIDECVHAFYEGRR